MDALFTITLDTVDPVFRETAKSNLDAIARRGLSEEYLFLTCYADYTVSEYILGTGPMGVTPLSVAYDRMDEAHSYELYQKEHTAGEFGPATSTPLMSEADYQTYLDGMVRDAEAALAEILEGREAVVFLAPMGAHGTIAVEAWQAVAQWDVQRAEDGTLQAVRYGAREGDPEHTQTLANLKSRITAATTATSTTATSTAATTTATSTAATTTRIATVSGLNQYYHSIGVADGMDGGYSDTIRIIDNPLLLDGGQAYALSSDEALLKWTTDTSATNYESRYRRLGYYTAFGIGSKDHTNINWPKGAAWPYYHGTETEAPDTPGNQTIDDLDEGEIYAFQINYEIGDTKVFSARDAYVWPSSDYPGDGELVGTYTFFGHHPNGEFEYIICKDTFPAGQRNQWVKLIKSAFGQWATSTDQFITMIPRIDGEDGWRCADRTGPIGQFIMDDDERNEVRMLDGGQGLSKVLAFPEVNSDVFKLCIAGADACVTSFSGYSGIGANDTLRTLYAQAHDDCDNGDPDGCANLVDLQWSILLAAFFSNREAENEIESVDVIFNQGSFGNPVGTPASTQFNTCLSNVNPAVAAPGHDYEAYRIAVHEAGHALGLSNFSYAGLVTEPLWTFFEEVQPYEAAHPTIPDAVMNYDKGVPEHWATWAPSPLNEPDCSPHPFDVMAIYALYQADP